VRREEGDIPGENGEREREVKTGKKCRRNNLIAEGSLGNLRTAEDPFRGISCPCSFSTGISHPLLIFSAYFLIETPFFLIGNLIRCP
jgi:hypothetical protein